MTFNKKGFTQLDRKHLTGFTLIEILIVIAIIGILAAIVVPMFRGYIDRAKETEALAALRSLITAERIHHARYGAYATMPELIGRGLINMTLYTGTFFSSDCYDIATGDTVRAICYPAASTATRGEEVSGWDYDIEMDLDGTWRHK